LDTTRRTLADALAEVLDAIFVTNGIAVFNGVSSQSHEGRNLPMLLACVDTNVVEISEALTSASCLERRLPYSNFEGKYVYIWPTYTNGIFYLTGQKRPIEDTNENWINVEVATNVLKRIIIETKANVAARTFNGVKYFKAAGR
jgi:hypothetical protein